MIAVEPRGYGRSTDVDRPLSFEETADDIAALLKHRTIEHADVFGESFGGIVALQLAIRYPQVVRRVAVYGTALGKFAEVTGRNRWGLWRLGLTITAFNFNEKATRG